jgi:hypothetical protein
MGLDLLTVMHPPLVAFLYRAQRDVGEQRGDNSPWGVPLLVGRIKPSSRTPAFNNWPTSRVTFRSPTRAYTLHQQVAINLIETTLDDPLVGRRMASAVLSFRDRPNGRTDMLQSAVAASSGSKSIRDMPEVRLEDRLQKVLKRVLYEASGNRRNAEASELPRLAWLRDPLPSAGTRSLPARSQVVAKLL